MTWLLAAFLPLGVLFEAWWSAAAVTGGAVSIPVIIHLLNRRRFKVVEWAAMRFLVGAKKKNTRKLRLEQFLLLLCRCLVIALLALAMISVTSWAEAGWRWAFPDAVVGVQASSVRTHKILVVDGSFSMDLRQGEKTSFGKALDMARKIVKDSSGGDAFSVILMASPPRRIVGEPSEDSRKVLAEIDKLRLPHGVADMAATLNSIEGLLASSPGKFAAREVYFLTDLQASTWIVPQPAALTGTLEKIRNSARGNNSLYFINVGQEVTGNLAVTNLTLGEELATTGRISTILATLHNYGTESDEKVVSLLVGKVAREQADEPLKMNEVQTTRVKVERNQDTPVAFTYKFPAPGEYVLQVKVVGKVVDNQIAPGDNLALDDVRTVVVTVKKDIPVALVNGKPVGEVFDQASEWLRLALNPFDERAESGALVQPKTLTPTQFSDESAGDLTPYDCVVLCDVSTITPSEARRLERFVRRGGGVIFALGPQVQAGEYNRVLFRQENNPVPALLPASLLSLQKVEKDAPFHFRFNLEADSDRTQPLSAFRAASDQASLLSPRFRAFFKVSEPSSGARPRRVISFEPEMVPGKEKDAEKQTRPLGGPAILEWNPPSSEVRKPGDPPLPTRLRGKTILITTAVNAEWSNWPASPSFPALMNELVLFASAGRLREQATEVSQPLELFLNTPDGGLEASIATPDGRTETARTLDLDEGSVLRFFDTDISGLYRVTLGNHKREYPFAVNVPINGDPRFSESDLTPTSAEDLAKIYGEIKLATDPSGIVRDPVSGATIDVIYQPLGTAIARWLLLICLELIFAEVILAWMFGHYSGVVLLEEKKVAPPLWQTWGLRLAPILLLGVVLLVSGVLLHDALTGDFLGFLPGPARQAVETVAGVPAPAVGEESHWRLEYTSYLYGGSSDVWLGAALGLAALALVWTVYRREGRNVRLGQYLVLTALRMGVILLMLIVFLPQLRLWFERQSWPDIVVLLDDSQSMSARDRYTDTRVREAADTLLREANLTEGDRLKLAQLVLTRTRGDWLGMLMEQKKVRLHVYHCSARAHRVADARTPADLDGVRQAIEALRAEPANDSSQLGGAIRQVINDFRGSSLAAIVMFTDGVTTEGEDLAKASKYAQQMNVPLFFVGLGAAHDVRDVALQDLQVEDTCYVNDRLVFELRLVATGYEPMQIPVTLHEKGKEDEEPLDKQVVTVDSSGKPIKVRLTHIPTKAGEKLYVIKTPFQAEEVDRDNNRLQRAVSVRETKLIKVLYVEGYRRYEYHFVKTLLERESNRIKGNKSIDLKVWLQDADPQHASQDAYVISELPARKELEAYDVVLLGDVNPRPTRDPARMEEFLKSLVDFVQEKGGGLLILGGERYMPRAYGESAIRDILPIELSAEVRPQEVDVSILESYQLELTPTGRVHPIFRFSPDERENDEIWSGLRGMYWYAEGYQAKRAAEILALHPRVKLGEDREGGTKLPLVLQQFVGAGRCMFFGFHETWRWGFREDLQRFNQFWVQTIRYLSRSRLGRIDLRLDRQTNYRRGEPIKVMVRFPDDAPPPPDSTEVKVVAERRLFGTGDAQTRTLQLSKIEGSRASYEAVLTQTPEGEYSFWLSTPSVPEPRPHAECKVLAPPGEMYGLRLNQAELELAAEQSGGQFYSLADADRVVAALPDGNRVTLASSGPPWLVWTYPALFLLAIALLTTEWLWRKWLNLL